jgi:hypothetical protein
MSLDIIDASKALRCPVKIATRWQSELRSSEPVPGREFHPLKSSAFHGALVRQLPIRWESVDEAKAVEDVRHRLAQLLLLR